MLNLFFRTRKLRKPIHRKKRAYSLLEVVICSGLSVIALGGSSMLLISGMTSWIMGTAKVNAEESAEDGIRLVTSELRGAMQATIDPNGNGITYELPAVGSDGSYLVPITWDGVNRRLFLQGSNLMKTVGNQTRTLETGVTTTDPLSPGGTGTYKLFTAGIGSVVREVTVELVTQRSGVTSAMTNARNRETIYMRNVPQVQ